MKAEDTVINYEKDYERAGCMENLDVDALLSRQAEVSFKLGATQAIAKVIKPAGELYRKAIRQGRREVVDWLINDSYETTIHFGEDWQDKLREWGIK